MVAIPHEDDSNSYLALLGRAIESKSVTVKRCQWTEAVSGEADVLWIHWPEHLGIGTPPADCALRLFADRLSHFSKRGIVVWTVHNLRPHFWPEHPGFRRLFEIVAEHASVQIHHGNKSVELAGAMYPCSPDSVIRVVGHGGYWNLLGGCTRYDARAKLDLPSKERIVLVFGSLRSKAEHDMVIAAAKAGWFVLVAGRLPPIRRWKRPVMWFDRWLVKDRLRVVEGYIGEKDIDTIVKASDAVLIARTNVLNSGNVFLGWTFDRAVIGPDEGNVGEVLANTGNPVFDPSDPDSLSDTLQRCVTMDLDAIGSRSGQWLRENGKWEAIAEAMLDGVRMVRNCL